MQECGNWDHPICWFPFVCLQISREQFLGALAVIPASSAESLLLLLLLPPRLLPQSRAASPGPSWVQGAPLRLGCNTRCAERQRGGCPPSDVPRNFNLRPWEAPLAGTLQGLNLPSKCTVRSCFQRCKGIVLRPSGDWCSAKTVSFVPPTDCNAPRIYGVNVDTDYFKILFSFCSTEGEGATGKLFQFHYSYG